MSCVCSGLGFCGLLCMGLVNSVGLLGFGVYCGVADLFVVAYSLVILLDLIA